MNDDPPRYEFSEYQNEIIAKFAASLQNVGMLTLFFGVGLCTRAVWMYFVLTAIGRRELGVTSLVSAFGQVTVAFMMVYAGRRLMNVARNEGDNLAFLMDGMRQLGNVYIVQAVVTASMIVFILAVGASLL